MSDGISIDVSKQDYDIDVCLGGTVFSLPEGGGNVTYSGFPVANQVAVWSAEGVIRGFTNLVYDGSSLSVPNVKVDHLLENTISHGIQIDNITSLNDFKNIGVYTSGFSGEGYNLKFDAGLASLTLDNLTVRRKMSVYELEIREINHIGGSLLISVADGKVESYTGSGPYNLYFDTNNGVDPILFQANDCVRAQIWTGAGVVVFEGTVTFVGTNYITVTSTDTPWIGMRLCQVGHPTNTARQNMIYITAADDNNPYIDMLAGVTDGDFSGHQKVRLGNLTGIIDADFGGALTGYGLYANNVYLKGHLNIVGADGYINISDRPTELGDINSTEGTKLTGIEDGADVTSGHTAAGISGQGSLATLSYVSWLTHLTDIPATLGTPTGSGLFLSSSYLGFYADSTWKTYMDNTGNFVLGDYGGGNAGLTWNQGTGVLSIRGVINITGGGNIDHSMVDGLGDLALVSSADWDSQVGGTGKPANNATVGASWGTNLSDIPIMLQAPDGAGLYLSATHMGYYSGSEWQSYIDSSGNCVFQGVGAFGMLTGTNGGISIEENIIWENTQVGPAYIEINTQGYQQGTTYPRGFIVGDGMGYNFLFCLSSEGHGQYSGNVSWGGVLDQDWINMEVFGRLEVYDNFVCHKDVDLAYSGGTVRFGYFSAATTIVNGPVVIGNGNSPNSYACLDLSNGRRQSGAKGAFIVPNMTETERNNLTAYSGMIIFNTTTVRFNIYIDAWKVMEWQ